MRVVTYREKPEYHDSFGRCIYCNDGSDAGGGLTKEHIVPFALDGSIVLRGASCAKCQKETKEIEKRNFQGQNSNFGVFLMHDNYHYRRKKKKPRPKHLPITVRTNTHLAWRMVPVKDRPPVLVMPEFEEPGLLLGRKLGKGTTEFRMRVLRPSDSPSYADRHGGPFTIRSKFDVLAFAKLLAKIAHGSAVVHYGLDNFIPVLPEVILGKIPDATSHLIGAWPKLQPIPPINFTEKGRKRHAVFLQRNDGGTIAAGIQLFCEYDTPVYCVIVGKLKDHARSSFDARATPLTS